jgi:hypothetical protein
MSIMRIDPQGWRDESLITPCISLRIGLVKTEDVAETRKMEGLHQGLWSERLAIKAEVGRNEVNRLVLARTSMKTDLAEKNQLHVMTEFRPCNPDACLPVYLDIDT